MARRRGPTIQSLTLAELKRYDIGRINPASEYGQQFPDQKPADGERFPTLDGVLCDRGRRPDVRFNIEIKTNPTKPDDTRRSRALRPARRRGDPQGARPAQRSTIQSFDWRRLRRGPPKLAPEIATGLPHDREQQHRHGPPGRRPAVALAGRARSQGPGGSVPRLAKAAGCAVWSPFWRNVTAENVAEAHALGLKVMSLDRQRSGRDGPADRSGKLTA